MPDEARVVYFRKEYIKMEQKFFICKHCGNLVAVIHASGVPMVCCGDPMTELVPNTTDAAKEKHVPVVAVKDGKVLVNVGSVDHPMVPEHYIQWIYLLTENGSQRRTLHPGEKPHAVFALAEGEKPVAVYEYCNLHGLWKADIKA